ncbi:MAG: serine hydrolase [Sphingomonadales bacterium]|nr:serine hydrolase [Sphingomonadales bacterium]MDE2567858.1 serine hydrolase [Sphingomonadales bacterium]
MTGRFKKFALAMAMAAPLLVATAPVRSQETSALQQQRDQALQQQVERIVAGARGRVGIAAADLDGGGQVMIDADQLFPMASTTKIAIAATYLSQVETGRLTLDEKFPLLIPVRQPVAEWGPVAKVREGSLLSAQSLMELSITRSDNEATDALLRAVGGPRAVNAWLASKGITNQHLDSDIATLVRDDGRIDPATTIVTQTASTPRAMIALLAAIDRGDALSPKSRAVLLDTMTRTVTGSRRIRAGLPKGTLFAHKTGSLHDVTCDVGIVRLPDGRHLALAMFFAGPDGHRAHGEMMAEAARVLYDGFASMPSGHGTIALGR